MALRKLAVRDTQQPFIGVHDNGEAVFGLDGKDLDRAGGGGKQQHKAVAGLVVVIMLQHAAGQVAIADNDMPERQAAFLFIQNPLVEPGTAINIEVNGIMGAFKMR